MSEWQPISMDEMLKDDTPMPLFKEDVIRYIYMFFLIRVWEEQRKFWERLL